jgi:hypothetical protein
MLSLKSDLSLVPTSMRLMSDSMIIIYSFDVLKEIMINANDNNKNCYLQEMS